MKWNIARHLCDLGCRVTVLPGTATADEVLAHKPDGVFLSNGPGDPEPLDYAIGTIRELLGKTPIFGICLGHQLLSLACGAKTFKLKFGHRGANQPVQNLETGRVEITSQNHGFAVAEDDLPAVAGSDASQSERRHDRRRAPSRAAGLQRAVSSRSLGRAARQRLSVRRLLEDDRVAGLTRLLLFEQHAQHVDRRHGALGPLHARRRRIRSRSTARSADTARAIARPSPRRARRRPSATGLPARSAPARRPRSRRTPDRRCARAIPRPRPAAPPATRRACRCRLRWPVAAGAVMHLLLSRMWPDRIVAWSRRRTAGRP